VHGQRLITGLDRVLNLRRRVGKKQRRDWPGWSVGLTPLWPEWSAGFTLLYKQSSGSALWRRLLPGRHWKTHRAKELWEVHSYSVTRTYNWRTPRWLVGKLEIHLSHEWKPFIVLILTLSVYVQRGASYVVKDFTRTKVYTTSCTNKN